MASCATITSGWAKDWPSYTDGRQIGICSICNRTAGREAIRIRACYPHPGRIVASPSSCRDYRTLSSVQPPTKSDTAVQLLAKAMIRKREVTANI
jgi:hypothetical protein